MEVTPDGRIERIVAEGQDESVDGVPVFGVQGRLAVGDDKFHFVPPPGVETIQGGMEQ